MNALPSLEGHRLASQVSMPLGMAQLAVRGLAEEWWLKYIGDVHWHMIAEAVGQDTTVFRDATGRQVYAAFCATEFEQLRPDLAKLGQTISHKSELWSAGKSRIQSNHSIRIGGAEVARVRLVSTFVAHAQTGVNASIRRAVPYLVPVLHAAPDGFAKDASAAAKLHRAQPADPDTMIDLRTCIGSDFNAVGLLYFPSYTRFFEQVETCVRPAVTWTPVRRRRVIYFSNIEPGEQITGAVCGSNPQSMGLWRAVAGGEPPEKLAHCMSVRF